MTDAEYWRYSELDKGAARRQARLPVFIAPGSRGTTCPVGRLAFFLTSPPRPDAAHRALALPYWPDLPG